MVRPRIEPDAAPVPENGPGARPIGVFGEPMHPDPAGPASLPA